MIIRPETEKDYPHIFEVNCKAFASDVEAKLVDSIRFQVEPWISLVAQSKETIVGHILFTPVTVEETKAIALGPMAILPQFQRKGIGSKLVIEGLEACKKIGEKIVFVLGHPNFYAKFGFQLAAPKKLLYKSEKFAPYFMVLELTQNALKGLSGHVVYHPLFDAA